MPENDHGDVRPRTAAAILGFDPHLSLGSARPAVFRSSTDDVFASPEAAEHAFAITMGKIQPAGRESVRRPHLFAFLASELRVFSKTRLCRSRPSHRCRAVFNSGMAAIMTAFFAYARPNTTIVYTTPLYGGTTGLIHTFMAPFGVRGVEAPSAMLLAHRRGDPFGAELLHRSARDAGHPDADHDWISSQRRRNRGGQQLAKPVVMVDNTFLGPTFQHPLLLGADVALYSGTKYLAGFSDKALAGVAITKSSSMIQRIRSRRNMFGNIPCSRTECWMLDSRLPTVSLRMNRQSAGKRSGWREHSTGTSS